jgi:hypothetical protein
MGGKAGVRVGRRRRDSIDLEVGEKRHHLWPMVLLPSFIRLPASDNLLYHSGRSRPNQGRVTSPRRQSLLTAHVDGRTCRSGCHGRTSINALPVASRALSASYFLFLFFPLCLFFSLARNSGVVGWIHATRKCWWLSLPLVCGLLCLADHLAASNFSNKFGSEFPLEELRSVLLTSVEF